MLNFGKWKNKTAKIICSSLEGRLFLRRSIDNPRCNGSFIESWLRKYGLLEEVLKHSLEEARNDKSLRENR